MIEASHEKDSHHLPLINRRVIVTRAVHQASALSEKFRQLGAEVIEIPTIQIASPLNSEDLNQAVEQLDSYDWIIFASSNAVTYFMDLCQSLGNANITTLRRKKIAAIGPATARALRQFDLQPDFQPEQSVAESLVEEFPNYPNLQGTKILWPRTDIGRNLIAEKLAAAGAQMHVVDCYRTTLPDDAQACVALLKQHIGGADVSSDARSDGGGDGGADGSADARSDAILTVASSQSVRNLALLLRRAFSIEHASQSAESSSETSPSSDTSQLSHILKAIPIISIGPQTTATALECLGKCNGQAERFDTDGLVDAVCAYAKNNPLV